MLSLFVPVRYIALMQDVLWCKFTFGKECICLPILTLFSYNSLREGVKSCKISAVCWVALILPMRGSQERS